MTPNLEVRSKKVAVVIPSYNEKENLPSIIPAIFKQLPDAQVIVIDDNSPDQSAQVVAKLQPTYPGLHLLTRQQKEGRGSAVIYGFTYAQEKLKADIVIEMDADLSHNPEELPELVEQVGDRTVVLASRYTKGGAWVDCPPKRILTSYLGNWLIRTVLGLPFKDNTNGFRAYPKAAVGSLCRHNFVSQSYIVLSESAKVLQLNGFKIIEVPSIFINRQKGNSNTNIQEFINSFKALIRIKRHLANL